MKKINKEGFTLIELLAVIVIISILLLAIIPNINKSLTDSVDKNNKNSTLSIVRAADSYFTKYIYDDNINIQFDGTTNLLSKLELSGKKPSEGTVVISGTGKVSVGAIFGNKCYFKEYDETKVTVTTDKSKCRNLDISDTN